MMNRRSVFRNLVIVAGGILIMPSCSQDKTKASIRLNNLDIDAETERLLAEIADTIIPETDTPGARSLNIHLFVLKMLDDCYEKESQQKFIAGLKQLDADIKKRSGNTFVISTTKERSRMLQRIENEEGISADVRHFYSIMKERTIQGYMNSKYVMTNLVIYELIPSTPYNGYAPA